MKLELIPIETQVQPFNLKTPDNETLYGWHLIPLHLCHEHEDELNANEPSGPHEDYTQTSAFKLLAKDLNARVVVNCECSPEIFNISCIPLLNSLPTSSWQCCPSWFCPATRNLPYDPGSIHALQPCSCILHRLPWIWSLNR